ncbi:MAG: Asp23/Gls24 family envelope stress response protein [Erysipelotrichaceae bacterium]|nr:Asp23/Gls24 family envelope stress response protein [Erysipelotrichaceae bacterium]MDD3809600.1 Asp23/Gls24 family envelope stress response protein [Erysipelotrichaceae bacterium]
MIEKNNNMGTINISLDVVATVAGSAATECYGVVGMSSQKVFKDGYYDLLKKENYAKGIVATNGKTGLILDLYVIVGYGMKLTEVLHEVQKKVKYVVETTLGVNIESVNIYVQEIRVIE